MPILLTCECGKQLRVKDENAGRRVKCPACGHEMVAPTGGGEAAVRTAPAAAPPAPAGRSRREQFDEVDDDEDRDEEDVRAEGGRRARRGPKKLSGKAVASLVFGVLS